MVMRIDFYRVCLDWINSLCGKETILCFRKSYSCCVDPDGILLAEKRSRQILLRGLLIVFDVLEARVIRGAFKWSLILAWLPLYYILYFLRQNKVFVSNAFGSMIH